MQKKETENIIVEFSNEAEKQFGILYEKYEKASNKPERRRDENLFRQLSSQYLFTLRYQLEKSAMGFIDKYKAGEDNITLLRQMLTSRIDFFVNEFSCKTDLL